VAFARKNRKDNDNNLMLRRKSGAIIAHQEIGDGFPAHKPGGDDLIT